MTGIKEAKNTVVEFLQKALDVKDVKVIGATKVDNQWHIEAEVYEENSFLKSLGLPTRVQDRNIYEVRLNDNLEVESYERQGHTLTTS
jgi:alcohol dehydrogenase YqhD (iron-dependent ADH family)